MRRLLATLLLALASLPAVAAAGVPSAANSTVPACMAVCPMGDMPFTVVVRDIANNPSVGSVVALDFTSCPGALLCPSIPTDPYVTDPVYRILRAATGAGGSVTFPARVGGTGSAGCVQVVADGVVLASLALASPDQDGSGLVGTILGQDDPIFFTKLGTTDPTADFDCSGHVDAVDQQIFSFHHSHSCIGYVDPTRRSTWGGVKSFYR